MEYKAKRITTYPVWDGDIPSAGTVTSVSVNTANGFSGSVSDPTTTPAISLQTSVTGVLKGNGVGVSAATAVDIPTTNALSYISNELTSTVNGVASNTVDISGVVPPTTNTLVNNGDNTMTSTVDSVASTDSIIDAVGLYLLPNAIGAQVNGVDSGSVSIISTNALNLTGTTLKTTINGLDSNTVDIQTPPASILTDVQSSGLLVTITATADVIVALNSNPSLPNSLCGFYVLKILALSGSVLVITFTLSEAVNSTVGLLPPSRKITIINVEDSNGVINKLNLTNYIIFINYLRTNVTTPYTALTIRFPTGLFAGTNFISVTCTAYSQNFNRVNTALSQYIGDLASFLPAPDSTYILNGEVVVTSNVAPVSNLYGISVNATPNTAGLYLLNGQTGVLTANSTPTVATGTSPSSILVTPDCRFAYVVNTGVTTVSQYSINILTGVIAPLSPATFSLSVTMGVMHPSGKFAFFTNQGANLVYKVLVNQTTGALSSAVSIASTDPLSITISKNGYWAYVTNNSAATISMFAIDQTTGALTALSTPTVASAFPFKIAITPDDRYLYCTNNTNATLTRYSISKSTGILTSLGAADATGSSPRGVAITPDGRYIYIVNNGAQNIGCYGINDNGSLTALSPITIATGTGPVNLTISSNGSYLFVVNRTGGTIGMYTIDGPTGKLTANGTPTIATGALPNDFILF